MATFALLAVPAAAAGVEEAVVPPSNSAATQYTETFPTLGGDKKTDKDPNQRSPSKVLGSQNTRKLEQHGPEGQAAAEAAAATAPSTVETDTTTSSDGSAGKNSKGGSGSNGTGRQADTTAIGQAIAVDGTAPPPAAQPAGSSGIGSAIEQATGLSTSGQSGALLPLVIIATILCSIAYLWRQRRQVD